MGHFIDTRVGSYLDMFKFSVVIPTHNRLDLLKDAIETVIRQDCSNVELVVFDNASTENIRSHVESLNDGRIRYERTDEFLPVTASWNRAIDLVNGDYVTLLGDDDGLAPGYFGKISRIIDEFKSPEVLYSALFQFMHPGVAPWDRGGYVADLKNAFFFVGRQTPFLLQKEDAFKAVQGSLNFHRKFTFNIQAFVFSRTFLDKLREDGPVFRSPFPDYYLANVALAKARSIVAIPTPLSVAGVSKASFGFTLFNDQEEKGAAMLKTNLSEDTCYHEVEQFLLPGSQYNTNYAVTMENVVRYVRIPTLGRVDFKRYRRLQIFTLLAAAKDGKWSQRPSGEQLWAKINNAEKLLTLCLSLFFRYGRFLGIYDKIVHPLLWRLVNPMGFSPIVRMLDRGSYSNLVQVFNAIENGTIKGE
ncbi:MAG: glycosyltransferase family 2 protein [Leptospirales bacterium]